MKVTIGYESGHYWMVPAETREEYGLDDYTWTWYSSRIVEIPDKTWAEYKEFLTQSAKWHNYISRLDLDNEFSIKTKTKR